MRKNLKLALVTPLLVAAVALPTMAHPAARAPRMTIASFNELEQPLPRPYDESSDADRAVAAARARARRAGKLLLIDLGGNWCLDCRILAGAMETAPLDGWLARRFEIVNVDVGRFNRNLQIPARYGITARLEGVPALLIIDPRTNRLRNPGRVTALADARSMTPQGLADWLAQWATK